MAENSLSYVWLTSIQDSADWFNGVARLKTAMPTAENDCSRDNQAQA
jgi:hypothetical protein